MSAHAIGSITGVIPAVVTPFDHNEAFDEARMRDVVRFLIDRKLEGLYLTGSTGEGFLMSPEERKRVVEVAIDENAGRLPVMVHVGAIGTHLSVDLAKHAEAAGADAISAVPPFYWSFPADQVFSYYADITASTKLPMVAYNVPLANLMGFDLLQRIAGIEGMAGVKYTAPTHGEIIRIKQEIGKQFIVYSGADEMALSGLSFGADGIIGSFYNLMPEVFQALRDAVAAGDLKTGRKLQETADAVIYFALARGGTAMIKRGMAWLGCDAGYCRKPFSNHYDAAAEARLKDDFRRFRDEKQLKGVAFLDAI